MKTKFTYIVMFFAFVAQSAFPQVYKQESTSFTPKSPTDTYLGAILDSESLNTDTHKFINVPVKPIVISTSFPSVLSTTIENPSYNRIMEAIRESVPGDEAFKQNISFTYNIKELNSYNELSLPFGQTINPATFFDLPKGPKAKKTLLLVNIQQVLFEAYMDIPHDGKLYVDTTDLKPYDMDKLIYIHSMQFGRRATLVVESDLDYLDVQQAVREMLRTELQPSQKSKSVLANSIIRIMTIGGEEIAISHSDNPLENVMDYFYKKYTIQDLGTPISFTASYLKHNGVFANEFTIE